jgi:hypothetical protein
MGILSALAANWVTVLWLEGNDWRHWWIVLTVGLLAGASVLSVITFGKRTPRDSQPAREGISSSIGNEITARDNVLVADVSHPVPTGPLEIGSRIVSKEGDVTIRQVHVGDPVPSPTKDDAHTRD